MSGKLQAHCDDVIFRLGKAEVVAIDIGICPIITISVETEFNLQVADTGNNFLVMYDAAHEAQASQCRQLLIMVGADTDIVGVDHKIENFATGF